MPLPMNALKRDLVRVFPTFPKVKFKQFILKVFNEEMDSIIFFFKSKLSQWGDEQKI